jgi:hypothetical protein
MRERGEEPKLPVFIVAALDGGASAPDAPKSAASWWPHQTAEPKGGCNN